MSMYRTIAGSRRYVFRDLKDLLAKATPLRSGDVLAGVAAESAQERVAAQRALADLPLTTFLNETVVPYESDEVTRLIVDTHYAPAFAPVASRTVGGFRDWLLSEAATTERLAALAPGLTPEMAAAVSKIMRAQDLIAVAAKCRVVTRFRNTIGLPGRLSTRLQPNHPTDDPRGIAASILDGLRMGSGDAVIGINPATDNPEACVRLLHLLDDLRRHLDAPIQSCVLAHVTTTLEAIRRGAPVDLVFQSIAGTEAANRSFGVDLALLTEAQDAALSLKRGTLGQNVLYFETGQGSALSAGAYHGVDQQTLEARAYAIARHFSPLLVNTVVGFIGPEYLFDSKQITRAGLEDHFCGKLLGLPMGCDICYTNHAEADGDDMDGLLTLLGVAGCTYIMGVPGADDIMLGYQSTSFHDAMYVRQVLGKRPAPEFEAWMERVGLADAEGQLLFDQPRLPLLPTPALGHGGTLKPPDIAAYLLPASEVGKRKEGGFDLRALTDARVSLGRTGAGLPTAAHLDFQFDHALARDAVHASLGTSALLDGLQSRGLAGLHLQSAAPSRRDYLLRPDRGRRLDDDSRALLAPFTGEFDAVFVLADGLSAAATNHHALPLLDALLPALSAGGWKMAPVVALVEQGRVAVGDGVAEAIEADQVIVLLGERPGLSAPDSLGIYLTWRPRPRITTDAERNCISNVRTGGLPYEVAAQRLLYLMREARQRRLSGVTLKEEADRGLLS